MQKALLMLGCVLGFVSVAVAGSSNDGSVRWPVENPDEAALAFIELCPPPMVYCEPCMHLEAMTRCCWGVWELRGIWRTWCQFVPRWCWLQRCTDSHPNMTPHPNMTRSPEVEPF